MTKFYRAASIAAVFLCALGMSTASAPGFALGLANDTLAIPKLNAPIAPEVPEPAASVEEFDPKLAPQVSEPTLETAVIDTIAEVEPIAAPATRFATLAQAVAAQAMPGTIDRELHCLAGTIYFESKSEPLTGQLAVAQVVLNRTRSGRFPKSVCSVVTQRGQFSFVRSGAMPSVSNGLAAYRQAVAVAQVARAGLWDSPVPKALFFHARRVSPGWKLTRIASVGNHVFYR